MTELPVRVNLDAEASPGEIADVEQVLRLEGMAPGVTAEWRKPPGVGNGAMWMLLVAVGIPLFDFLRGFGSKLGQEAGEGAAAAFRGFIKRLRQTRQPSPAPDGWINVEGSDGTELAMAEMPDEAYRALFEADWSRFEGGTVMWDYESEQWFDASRRP